MGIESERTALSIESIPKSLKSEVQMDQTVDTLGGESAEPPERQNQQKINEKNGNLDLWRPINAIANNVWQLSKSKLFYALDVKCLNCVISRLIIIW